MSLNTIFYQTEQTVKHLLPTKSTFILKANRILRKLADHVYYFTNMADMIKSIRSSTLSC